MMIRVDPDDALPVYEQIRLQVATMVASGVLLPGTQLPTIRQLAADLGLAKGTISKAYEALLRDSVIDSRGRGGTVVAERGPEAGASRNLVEAAAERMAVAAIQSGLGEAEAVDQLLAAFKRFR
jgi:GntR family transcriptional regulator